MSLPIYRIERQRPMEPVRISERDPYRARNRYRRADGPAQMLGWVIAAAIVAVIAFGLGVVHGRVNPAREVPVGNGPTGEAPFFDDYLDPKSGRP